MTSTDIELPSSRVARADRISQGTAVEQARAVAEVAAAVRVAQDNPRNAARATEQIKESCGQPALADRAFYSLPRAGGRIEGETVHLARELARCWGNIDHGIRELRRDDDAGESEMQAWAWDQEQNVRASRSFIVPHARMVGRGTDKRREALIDLADIANNNNSVAARAVRETIFQVIPPWFKATAVAACMHTLQNPGGKTLPQQIAEAVAHFRDRWNVTLEQLEARLERKSDRWTPQDIGLLRVISGELDRGEKRVEDQFPASTAQRVTSAEIQGQRTQQEPATPPADEPAPEQPRAARMIAPAQMRKLQATYKELGVNDRDERLADVSAVVGRDIASTSDLTADEAKLLLDKLAQRKQQPAEPAAEPAGEAASESQDGLFGGES